MATLKDKVLELVEIAKECPENLQVVCFELLLKHHLESTLPRSSKPTDSALPGPTPLTEEKQQTVEESVSSQDDLAEADLHLKVRHFMKKHSLSLEELGNLFYKEHGAILTLYEDLKTTRMAESQVRITLLQALLTAIATGDFECQVESVRKECNDRKCYDQSNFGANFTNNAVLFDFNKYTRSIKTIKLSEDGRRELAEIIKELQ